MTNDTNKVIDPHDPYLRNRLRLIMQEVPNFWEQGPYTHYTNHGPLHSERVHQQKLGQLAQELPDRYQLTQDEIFIVSAAAWLYEIGMQCPYEYRPEAPPTLADLDRIREKKHDLTYRMIVDSVKRDYNGPPLHLGLNHPDEYTQLIAEVCKWCSPQPLERVPESEPIRGNRVRVRLLVALLRLADQLYIEAGRINLNLLRAVELPSRTKARWWSYLYTQVLPIEKGRLHFYYHLPVVHQPIWLQIRTLIEEVFDFANNDSIKFLVNEYGLNLVPHVEAGVKYDQPEGFLLETQMDSDLAEFVRLKIPRRQTGNGHDEGIQPSNGRCLLVLDYENLLVQLGLNGYFFSDEEISRLLITMQKAAGDQFNTQTYGLAIGHWHRPDLIAAARMLESKMFSIVTVDERSSVTDRIQFELGQRLQDKDTYDNVLLVAPQESVASLARNLIEQKHSISAWISDLPEAEIFHIVIRNLRTLSAVLSLQTRPRQEITDPALGQEACILALYDAIIRHQRGLKAAEVFTSLQSIDILEHSASWWQLWLSSECLLRWESINGTGAFHLNMDHPQVQRTLERCTAVIRAMQSLMKIGREVREDALLRDLVQQPIFESKQETPRLFLMLLKDIDLLHYDSRPSLSDAGSLWYLNATHPLVVALDPNRYTSLLILYIDHFRLSEGYQAIHEHTMLRRATSYLGASTLTMIYELARKQGILNRKETDQKLRHSNEFLAFVSLTEDHPAVRTVMHDRGLLLEQLYYRSGGGPLARDALVEALRPIRSFTLDSDSLNMWLTAFERDGLLKVQHDAVNIGADMLQLNFDKPLTQRLLGRMIIFSLIQSFRILRATHPDRAQPAARIEDHLARQARRSNRQQAQWAIEYAQNIGLVGVERRVTQETPVELLYLRRHWFVQQLDHCEATMCQAVAALVVRQGQRSPNGWVPLPIVLREMDRDGRMGDTTNEQEYWLDQTIHRCRLVERDSKSVPGRPLQQFLRTAAPKRETT